ncbi:hypothetical protein C8R45DRAFT_401277 [Mycena sanguinolenta]|nr:hypothetical protein C8R45DRAFT_401277 [Mycena sanguinolenta]
MRTSTSTPDPAPLRPTCQRCTGACTTATGARTSSWSTSTQCLFVYGSKVPPTSKSAAITEAVAWLLTCPPPDPRRIGPVSGRCMFHCVYGVGQAPVPFVDATALEEHVNEALRRRPRRPTDRISLADEPVMFTSTTSSAIHRRGASG